MGASTDTEHQGDRGTAVLAALASRFPEEATLIARGKYSTLRKDKREQLERIQAICTTLVTMSQRVLMECQAKTQDEPQNIVTLAKCVENLSDARDRVIILNLGMAELEPTAWPK